MAKVIIEKFEEILDRTVRKTGSSAHIIVPKKHIGKRAKVIISGKKVTEYCEGTETEVLGKNKDGSWKFGRTRPLKQKREKD